MEDVRYINIVEELSSKIAREFCDEVSVDFTVQDLHREIIDLYKNGNMAHLRLVKFLGVSSMKEVFLDFERSREYARSHGFCERDEWYDLVRNSDHNFWWISKNPSRVYREDGWVSWHDWLGVEGFLSYEQAHEIVLSFGLVDQRDWKALVAGNIPGLSKPRNIPSSVDAYYKDSGWISWRHWLRGDGSLPWNNKFTSFKEARKFVRKLKLKNTAEWRAYCAGKIQGLERPNHVPSNPDKVYGKKGWLGFPDWLGLYLSYKQSRLFVRRLGLRTKVQWMKYIEGGYPDLKKLPKNIPSDPCVIYHDCGWITWKDWLGT